MSKSDTLIDGIIGAEVAIKILILWGATQVQSCSILAISVNEYKNVFAKNLSFIFEPNSEKLNRISFVLNIYSCLRTMFSNPKNCYGYMAMINNNDYLCGRTPLQIISNGCLQDIKDVYICIEPLVTE